MLPPGTIAPRGNIVTKRQQIRESRHVDFLERAFFSKDNSDVFSSSLSFRSPVEINDVVQVAWASPLSQRPGFLREDLREVIAKRVNAFRGTIRVRVRHYSAHRLPDEYFVCGQVHFDTAGAIPRMLQWVTKIHSCLAARYSGFVGVNLNLQLADWDVNAGVLVHPIRDFGKDPGQESLVEMLVVA